MIKITAHISLVALSACLAHCHFFEERLVCLLSGLRSNCSVCFTVTSARLVPSEQLGSFGSRLSLSSHSWLCCSAPFAQREKLLGLDRA